MDNVEWVYTWGYQYTSPNPLPQGVEFVPMIWGRKQVQWLKEGGLQELVEKREKGEIRHLLGFNEPDLPTQADMSVEEAIEAWPLLMKTGLRLGSPAQAKNRTGQWLDEFMAEIEKRKYRVDFICVHRYGGANASEYIRTIQRYWEKYKKPIWFTEFAVSSGNAEEKGYNRYTDEMVYSFMQELIPELDKLPYVERYSWFVYDRDKLRGRSSALFETGTPNGPAGVMELTELGELYRDLPGK